MNLEYRLFGSGNVIHWTAFDVEEICRRFGLPGQPPSGLRWRDAALSDRGVPLPPLGKSADDGKSVSFTISSSAPDRMNDVIDPRGWQTTRYRSNPIVLWMHDTRTPIGKATAVWREGEKLKATMLFSGSNFAQHVKSQVKEGVLRATSVGFLPVEWQWRDKRDPSQGIHFSKAELLEFSIVSVPANPDALIELGVAEKNQRSLEIINLLPSADTNRRRQLQVELLKLKG